MTQQETPRQVVEALSHWIDQREMARAAAQALADQYRATADRLRTERDLARQEAADWKGLAERRRDELSGVLEDAGALVDEKAAYLAKIEALTQACDELARIIGTETPIAALDLATTWQAEKAHMMDAYRQAVSDAAEYHEAHRQAEARVSSLRAALSDLLTGAEQQSQSHADVLCKCRAALEKGINDVY